MIVHKPNERRTLYHPGDTIKPLRLVAGRLRLLHLTESGNALELFALTPGDVLGFEGAVGLTCCWHVEELAGPVKLEPATLHEAMAEMGARLIYALIQRAEAWGKGDPTHAQLLAAIQNLRDQEGEPDGRLTVTHQRLAEVLWTTREAVTRRVIAADDAGLLRREGPSTYLPHQVPQGV